ncbi:hypothetical protein GBAR_LOCUS5585 [Geodia barretti]|uniref:Uncharacterized protein n=1 Tax=Geodia barretti TaxID=519541 RepID=A0AA35RAV6_GEOBA|nr:hypothetical protein GBAR_LOCUS5585 [Geodia barretti]
MKVLIWTTLQLLLQQYVTGSPVSLSGEETFVEVPPFRGPTFLKEAQQLLKSALLTNGGTSVCSHLQRVLNSSGKLKLVEYGSQPPDHSLLDDTNLLWSGSATLQKATVYLTLQAEDEGNIFMVATLVFTAWHFCIVALKMCNLAA